MEQIVKLTLRVLTSCLLSITDRKTFEHPTLKTWNTTAVGQHHREVIYSHGSLGRCDCFLGKKTVVGEN